eukprot:15350564-Ditylum_brightwellii.AAC.1
MKRCRSVQVRSRAMCNIIFTRCYGAPCRAIAKRLPHPTSPYSALRCFEPPPNGGFNTSSTYPPFGGYKYTFYVEYPPLPSG